MPSTDQTLLATAISEIARNITTYAVAAAARSLIDLVRDAARPPRRAASSRATRARGSTDLERAMTDGYTTGGGLGLGLPGARRLVDEFDIETAPGQGHDGHAGQVGASVPEAWPAALDRGVAGAPHEGEARSGDLAVFVADDRRRAGVRDRRARPRPRGGGRRRACAEVVRAHAEARAAGAARRPATQALLETRGAVMTAAWFDLERAELSWAGVGNVDARLVRVRAGAARGGRARLRRRARLPAAAACARRRCRWSAGTCW